MRIVDETGNTLCEKDVDLDAGYLSEIDIIRPDAVPPDDITKFAYDDGDYERVRLYTRIPDQELVRRQIDEKKQKLADTDYVVVKIAEGAAGFEEYAGIIAERRTMREEVNRLEQELAALEGMGQ